MCLSAEAAPAALPAPSPAPTVAPGPCERPALAAVAVRPGIGRAPATSGAVCVALPGTVVLGVGYRNQLTAGTGRQRLAVYPEPVLLAGANRGGEVIVAPGLAVSQRTGLSGSGGLPPASGQQDAGFGFQQLISDAPWAQQALVVFATVPTGYPPGPAGFSAGAPVYTVSYAIATGLGNFGLSTSQGIASASGTGPGGAASRFVAYQPTFNLSYALSPSTTALLEDQLSAPAGPHGPSGNRALAGLQRVVSPSVVLDAEYEVNLLPAPGESQHALGAGFTLRL